MKFILSSTELVSRMIWVLYGPAGSGKTTTAFTLCKNWPRDFVNNKKDVTLDDVIYWQIDPDGAIGLAPHHIHIQHVINFPALVSEFGFAKALHQASDAAAKLAKDNPKITCEIFDTITTFDKFSLTAIEQNPPMDRSGTRIDKRGIFGEHLANHRFMSTESMARPGRVSTVYLFHERVIDDAQVEAGSKAEKAKTKAKRMGDSLVHIIPATTGSGGEYYTNAVSLELSVVASPVPGKAGQFTRALYPLSHDGHRAKSRFQHLLTEKMPCDLGALRTKIQAACK